MYLGIGLSLSGHGLRGPRLDPLTRSYIERGTAAGGGSLPGEIVTVFNDFFVSAQDLGFLSAIKASACLSGWPNFSGILTPLGADMPTATAYNFVALDYDPATGLIGDGETKYIGTGYNSNNDGRNDVHMSAFVTKEGDPNNRIISGGEDLELMHASSSRIRVRINQSTLFTSTSTAGAFSSGLYFASRDNEDDFEWQSPVASGTEAEPSTVDPSGNYLVFARNVAGSPENISNSRIAFYSAGAAVDRAAINEHVTAMMTAIQDAWT